MSAIRFKQNTQSRFSITISGAQIPDYTLVTDVVFRVSRKSGAIQDWVMDIDSATTDEIVVSYAPPAPPAPLSLSVANETGGARTRLTLSTGAIEQGNTRFTYIVEPEV